MKTSPRDYTFAGRPIEPGERKQLADALLKYGWADPADDEAAIRLCSGRATELTSMQATGWVIRK